MLNQNKSLNKKDLSQVVGGGLGHSKMKIPSRGKPAKALFAQYQTYFGKEMTKGNTPMQFQDWLKLRNN